MRYRRATVAADDWHGEFRILTDRRIADQRNQEAIHPGLWDAFNLWERLRARSRR
jgi:hypothetical protein